MTNFFYFLDIKNIYLPQNIPIKCDTVSFLILEGKC